MAPKCNYHHSVTVCCYLFCGTHKKWFLKNRQKLVFLSVTLTKCTINVVHKNPSSFKSSEVIQFWMNFHFRVNIPITVFLTCVNSNSVLNVMTGTLLAVGSHFCGSGQLQTSLVSWLPWPHLSKTGWTMTKYMKMSLQHL